MVCITLYDTVLLMKVYSSLFSLRRYLSITTDVSDVIHGSHLVCKAWHGGAVKALLHYNHQRSLQWTPGCTAGDCGAGAAHCTICRVFGRQAGEGGKDDDCDFKSERPRLPLSLDAVRSVNAAKRRIDPQVSEHSLMMLPTCATTLCSNVVFQYGVITHGNVL